MNKYMNTYMKEWVDSLRQEIKQEAKQEGRLEGKQEALIETATNLLAEGINKLEVIARVTGLPLEEVKALAEKCKPAAT